MHVDALFSQFVREKQFLGNISPRISNVYLTAFDRALAARGHQWIRYCDDFVIPCASENDASQTFGGFLKSLARIWIATYQEVWSSIIDWLLYVNAITNELTV